MIVADEVKTISQPIILESVNPWKNYKKRVSVVKGQSRGPCAQKHPRDRRGMFAFNSWDLRMWLSMISITYEFIPDGDGQVLSGSASLPDLVVLETEDQTLKREQHECDVLETVGDSEYTCDTGMSVENVSVVVHIKTL